MLRLISILLLIGGMAAAAIGGAAVMEQYRPHDAAMMEVASAPAPTSQPNEAYEVVPPPEAIESMPETEAYPETEAMMEAAPEAMMEEAPPMASMEAPAEPMTRSTRSLSAGAGDDDIASVASAGDAFESADEGFDEFADFGAMDETLADSAGVAAPAPPTRSSTEAFLATLQTVPVAHETPRSAEYKRAFDVTLAIDATGDDTAVDALPGRGNVITGEARVSDRVEARLSGANFEIVEMSPGTQSLSPLTENVWRWAVMPLSAGDHDLVFEIYAIDQDAVVPLRTFRDTVTVQVSGINRAIAFADQANPLFVLLGGLGSAVAGLLGAVKFFGRR